MILSTGMASFQETQDALVCARENGAEDIVLLKCTSTYPASPAQSNLVTVPHMAAGFGCQVGLSDHTAGIGVAVGAVALGATVIEKHFVLDRQAGGVDAAFSLEPSELGALCTETKRAWQALGRVCYGGCTAEKEAKRYRRSIYVKRDVAAGERVTKDNIAVVRPAYGLAPRHYETVLGKTFRVSIRKGTALSWQHL